MSEFLDELARTIASPMPRRRALRMLGGALVTVAVPSAVRPRRAFAGMLQPGTSVGLCEKDCGGAFPVPCICPGPDPKYCFETCGIPGSRCCCYKNADGEPTGAAACPPGTRCGNPAAGESNCMCINTCGSPFSCCGQDEYCANPREKLCCKHGERPCNGRQCCAPNEECKTFRVGTGSSGVCTKRCPRGRAWCGRDKCCPPRWHCINERSGLCKRCRSNEEECGNKCCDRRTSRCCGEAGCCPKSRSCCVNGPRQVCCPPRTKCAIPILPGNIGILPRTPAICCPQERLNNNPKLCCPTGQIALNSPGLRIPPPGVSPFCCPRSLVCRSGGRTFCANLESDPSNCGSCGNVCQSGVCNGGICALP